MIPDEIKRTLMSHLTGQFERGLAILFTGAGFSMDCRNIKEEPIPSSRKLREVLWDLCFPGKPFSNDSSLSDLYSFAQIRHPRQLGEILQNLFTVEPESIPDYYRIIFGMPWFRGYTLNIDTLATAVSSRFTLPRPTTVISATTTTAGMSSSGNFNRFEYVHLNGTLSDAPENVTFSPTQYAERLARPDPWYIAFVANLLSHSVVFIGTRLEEAPMWQHIEMRRMRGGRHMQELRPRSYLVIPELDPAKHALLAEFNVIWVPASAQEFSAEILSNCGEAAARGLAQLIGYRADPAEKMRLPLVSELATNPMESSEFLLGEEPIWADVQAGRAIEREHDKEIWNIVEGLVADAAPGSALVITGTAGSGKSTALMRLALRISASGKKVAWLDKDSDFSPREIRAAARADSASDVIAIDDADLFGPELGNLVRDLSSSHKKPLVVMGIRSGRVDRVLTAASLEGVRTIETTVPHLSDTDIGALVDVLNRENRLGKLKGKPRRDQEAEFRIHSGRQLLVAMLSATSGEPFKDKPIQELNDLPAEGRHVYALVAVASAFRFKLTRDEIIMASGDRSNQALNSLESLSRRHIITVAPDGSLRARHRVIADLILDELQRTGELKDVLEGLAFVAATKVSPALRRNARPWRMLRAVINHEFLARTVFPEPARNLYASLEQLLTWDSHYWLQRGSLEVEFGLVALAENFLAQARGLAPDDPFVDTEWAYLLFRKAIENPHTAEAKTLVADAMNLLEGLIDRPGYADSYPYHVLGSQGLAWARRAIVSRVERERFLAQILRRLEQARTLFPRAPEIQQLYTDVKREHLMTTVEQQRSLL